MPVQEKTKEVTFICNIKPDAKTVYLVGDFNQWKPQVNRLTKNKDGIFRTRLTLPTGLHQYKYIVDGVWHEDPQAIRFVVNSYGTRNSVVVVE